MPRVRVMADDGWVALDERVGAPDFGSDVFRRHLAERLAWAVGDAEAHAGLASGAVPARATPAAPRELPAAA